MSIDPLAEVSWDDLISELPEASAFHSRAWMSVLAATYGHRFQSIPLPGSGSSSGWLVLGQAGSTLAGRKAVSLPFSDYAPPLLPPCLKGFAFSEAALELGRRWGCRAIEIRGGPPPRPDAVVYRSYASHVVDLRRGSDSLWEALSDSTRRSVRHANKSGLEVRCLTSIAGISHYFRLHCLTRRRLGLPPQPFKFFLNLQSFFLSAGGGFVVLAGRSRSGCGDTETGDLEGFHAVAGAVFLLHQRQAIYKFGASDARYLKDRPNHLVMWNAIDRLVSLGAETLNLGRSDLDQSGLLRYKRSWGGGEHRLDYYRYDLRRERFCPSRSSSVPSFSWLFSRLPLSWLRSAGCLLYPHLH